MNIYKLPSIYEMYDIVKVEASPLHDAIKYFYNSIDDIDLLYDPYYVEGSFDLSTRYIDDSDIYWN